MSKGEQTRQQIISRALSLSSEVGLEGLSLGNLASELKLSKSGLFAHFKSKEALQLEVLQAAIDLFVRDVVRPAITAPRGIRRVQALFDHYLAWVRGSGKARTCIFMGLSQEYDDRPGPVRDALAKSQRDWHETVARVAATAVETREFRKDLDVEQFAFEFIGIGMIFQQSYKLLQDRKAERRVQAAFEALLERSRG
ncbi:MAG TPA: TetR/AcrR family transcriptional regulator [Gammaproteobacteria bacterium]|nr:TetR/AcrR family transcriptional regulator [Gammaproteobacteria bacterium]